MTCSAITTTNASSMSSSAGRRPRSRCRKAGTFKPTNGNQDMSETTSAAGFKPKKSVALSGVTAGNTALCTVGRSGNDLHYRGYDILDLAEVCEFEEVAHLLVH